MRVVGHAVTARGGIVFDLDDTLYPHESFVRSGFEAIARHVQCRHGIPAADALRTLEIARLEGFRGRELQVLCERYDLRTSLAAHLRTVMRAHWPTLRLPEPSSVTLARMRVEGWRVGILTNGLPAIQRRKVAALNVRRLVHHVVYAEEHFTGGKPAPGPFREVLRRLGVPAERTICVGDDPVNDIFGARRLGMKTIRLRTRHAAVPPGAEADVVIASLHEVPRAAQAVLQGVASDAA